MVRLTGVWERTTVDGATYLSGTLGSARIIILPNKHKDKDAHPDYIIYLEQQERQLC